MSSLFRKASDPPAVFPTYLLPPLPFRRSSYAKSRHSSTSTTASTSTTDRSGTDTPSSNPFSRSPTPTPAPFTDAPIDAPTDKYLHGHTSHIHCAKCATDLCLTSQVISKGFTGRHGRAYLVQSSPSTSASSPPRPALPNTFLSRPIARNLVTGQHVVSDLSCAVCGSLLGWKYVEASEESQKYKVGKYILETKKIRVGVRWDNDADTGFGTTVVGEELVRGVQKSAAHEVDELDFDSQDDDECEDLFAGVWSPALASRRRQRKSERFRRKAAKVFVPRAGAGGSASQDSLRL